MSLLKRAVLVLLVTLLAVDLAVANAAIAADRTVLNPSFVTTTLEEEGAYEEVEPLLLEQLPLEELEGADGHGPAVPVDPRAVAAAALDPNYLQSQLEPNIERTYAYLHGNADSLDLAIDVEPAKTSIVDAVEAELTNASPTELVAVVADQSNTTFEAAGMTVDLTTVAQMAENESVFTAERQELRSAIREQVLTRLVDEAFASADNDQLLALVIDDYDPEAYTADEKEQLVADNEAEIRTALRSRIESERGDEIDARVDRELADRRDAIRSEVAESTNESLGDVPPAIAEPVSELMLVAVDGYVADVTHDEFSNEFEAAADDLASGVATVLETELDSQLPDRIDVDEQLDSGAKEGLSTVRRAVGIIDLLAIILPLLGVGLVGLVYLTSRSVATTAIGAGIGMALGGLPALIGATVGASQLRAQLAATEMPAVLLSLVDAVIAQVTNAVLLQSAVVIGLGVVGLAVGLALRYELVDQLTAGDPP